MCRKMDTLRRNFPNPALSHVIFNLEGHIVAHDFRDVQEMLQALRVSDIHYFRDFIRVDYFSHNTFHSFLVNIVLKYIKEKND